MTLTSSRGILLVAGFVATVFGISQTTAGSPKQQIKGSISSNTEFTNRQASANDAKKQLAALKKEGKDLSNVDAVTEDICSKQIDTAQCKDLVKANYQKLLDGTFNDEDLKNYIAKKLAQERIAGGHKHH
ncbi:hypothetical protein ABK040_014163 [Willaertia magna]